jgi:hypothetical protein
MWLLCSFQGPPRGAPEGIPRRRSLKTQQHARARAPRCVAPREGVVGTRIDEFRLARPGSVDVLGPVVGGHRIDSTCGSPEGDWQMAGNVAVPQGPLQGAP